MYDILLQDLEKLKKPIDVIVVGLGFMAFGFVSSTRVTPGIRIPLIISRRPLETVKFLKGKKIKSKVSNKPYEIKNLASKGYICVTDDLSVITRYKDAVVIEMTGTVAYGAEAATQTLQSGKHLITMNPELQATVGSELKRLADKNGVLITDVFGDQPGSLTRLIAQAKLMGFEIVIAGNMKRFMNEHATQEEMQSWADDKGLNVRQTTSFTDGTKQSIEMNLVANYFGMSVAKRGMMGTPVIELSELLKKVDFSKLPKGGIVDFAIGRTLFPGIFVIAKHKDPEQQKYLRYLSLGNGPYYLLFEPYHLCHLEVLQTIAKVVLHNSVTINNSNNPTTRTITLAKRDIKKGEMLDGIGGNTIYGVIEKIEKANHLLPVGLAQGAIATRDIKKDQEIKVADVELPVNAATIISGFRKKNSLQKIIQLPRSSVQRPHIVRL